MACRNPPPHFLGGVTTGERRHREDGEALHTKKNCLLHEI